MARSSRAFVQQPAWQRQLLVWLLLALVLAPALGRVHRVVHLWPSAPTVLAPALAAPDREAALPTRGGASWLHDLFAGHGPHECPLLDQLNPLLAGPPSLPTLPSAPPAEARRPAPPALGIAQAPRLGFLARAPPAFLSLA